MNVFHTTEIVYLKIVQMIIVMLGVFYHNKKVFLKTIYGAKITHCMIPFIGPAGKDKTLVLRTGQWLPGARGRERV